jgi:uncharacterized protein involved in cysteine biosynthesis
MNKYRVLGVALMVSILLGTGSLFSKDLLSIQSMATDIPTFLSYLAGLCVILFGSLAALTLDKLEATK